MATLTRAQAEKWNAQLSGGFTFDVQNYIIWGEKVARRNIKLEDGKLLQVTLEYHDQREGGKCTGLQQPALHFQIWEDGLTEGIMRSAGMGANVEVGVVQNKRNWKELCRLSGQYDDAKLLSMAADHMDKLKNPFVE